MTTPKAKKPRKQRVDSKEAAVAAMVGEKTLSIEPPDDIDMTKDDMTAFDEVVSEFAKVDWTPHTIRLAAILARSLVLMRNAQNDVIDEGFTITAPNGGARMNPAVSALNMISGQVMTSRRTLALHATASAKTGDVGNRRATNRANADAAPDDEEDLINTPPPVGSAATRALN